MKLRFSIKAVVVLACVSFSGCLILGYSILSAHFFSLGVAHVIMDNMETTADNYHRSVSIDRRKNVDYLGTYRITTDWKYMSKAVRQSFPEPVPPSRELYIAKKTGRFNKLDPDWYVMAIRRDNTVYYVSQWAGFGTPLGTFGWNSNENIRFLIVLSCIISMAIAVVFWLIMRQISRPMAALNIWANHLDGETVKNEMPDFYFRELNKMASFLMEKISEEHDRMRRDQQFLHYASHELRTPITIISQNIEVLKKLTPIDTEHARMMREKAVKRLGRASDNMGALIETLLWMGRKTTDDLPRKEIRIDSLIEEIVKNLAFLLKGKQIKVNLDTIPTSIFVAETPLRIVLANLIRNAFYHTSNGSVTIHQAADVVTITNEDLENDNNSNLGFGFGLSLTSKLVRKMDWSYRNKAGPKGHTVSICIKQKWQGCTNRYTA